MKRWKCFFTGLLLAFLLAVPVRAGELVVAHDVNFMPFEFMGSDGKYTGFDIQLWRRIAKVAGLDYRFRPMDFSTILPALEKGSVDVAMAGISITRERSRQFLFSDPYYESGLSILVRGDEKGIRTLDDLAGKVVVVKSGTSSEEFMEKFGKAREILRMPGNEAMIFELLTGTADAVVFDMPVLRDYAMSAVGMGRVKVVGPLYEKQNYGIAFPKGSEELVKKVNAALKELRIDGAYARIYKEWFGYEPQPVSGQ